MIKIIGGAPAAAQESWTSPDAIATVEVSSEDPSHPVEDALAGTGAGWRAATPGVQRLALQFIKPMSIRRVRLVFEERLRTRTQEFALDWRGAAGDPARSVVRQQFTFAPPGTPVETEDYTPGLSGVHRLELTLTPDIGDATAVATLKEWRFSAS